MRLGFCIALLGWWSCAALWGQATAQIHGTVQDSSGSAVPGAEIKAIKSDTGISRTVASGPDGAYVLTNLPVGPYRLEVTKEGFTKYLQSGIVLQVNSDPAIDPALKIGSVSEQISVQANATQVETRSTGVGEVIQTQRIVDLPLNGRNVTDLVPLAGAAVNTGFASQRFYNNLPMISIAGQPQTVNGGGFGTDYSLDGAYHLNYITGGTMPVAFPDAVQEFKVESSGQTAQRGTTASISIVTRSGSNSFHGNLFEFIRNNGFGSAREYFSSNSGLKRNQFGGTIGGPIRRNKIFFFGGFQETTIRQNPGNSISTVPTKAMLNGDWSVFASAACNGGTAKPLKAPFVNNSISPSLYSAPAMYIANKLASSLASAGITPNQCGAVTYNTPTVENDYQYVAKIDYQLNDKQSLFFRLLDTPIKVFNSQSVEPASAFNLLTMGVYGSGQLAHSYAFGHTFVISPSLVQSFRASFERTSGFKTTPDLTFDYCDAGVNIYCGYEPDPHWFSSLSITGGFSLSAGGGGTPNGFSNTGYALNDDLGFIHGAHQMTFGIGAVRGQLYNLTSSNTGGTFAFNGSLAGLGMADFFVGLPSQFSQGRPTAVEDRENSVDLYFTDTWKVNSRLTFTYGLRWEPFLPMTILNARIANFDMSRFLNNTRSTVFTNAPYGFYWPGDPGFPEKSGVYRKWDHFMPRGGVAWDPKGDGKMSLRASYAFGYSYIPGLTRLDQRNNNPWGGSTVVVNPVSFATPFTGVTGGNPFPNQITSTIVFPPGGDFLTNPYDLPTPTTYSWNASFQRQIGATWLASVTYIGSRVMHLYVNVPINAAQLVPGPIVTTGCAATVTNCNAQANIQARRVLSLLNPSQGPYIGNLTSWDPSGTQTYHGLLSSVQKRLSRGVSMSANWTWSHCIGIGSGPITTTATTTASVPNNPLFDKGNCATDRRHIVNLTAVAQSPRFSDRILRYAASYWQLSGIYRFYSGTPLNITESVDRALSGVTNQRPNLVASSPYTGQNGPSSQYLNPAAFVLPALGAPYGNAGYNAVVGPTYWDLDLALSRQFRVAERHTFEVRADAFNVTNSFIAGNPNPSVSSNQFGQILSAQPARQVQFAMKYSF